MVPQEVINVARACGVLVQIQGPDPKGRKMSRHAFFHSESGQTTLSASGLLLLSEAEGGGGSRSLKVITCASIVEPFLAQRPDGDSVGLAYPCTLIAGSKLDVLVEAPRMSRSMGEDVGDQSFCWIPAQLAALVDVPRAGKALQGLLDVHGRSVDGIWDVGWSLARANEDSRGQGLGHHTIVGRNSVLERENAYGESNVSKQRGDLGNTATRVAILDVCTGGDEEVVAKTGQVGERILELQESFKIRSGLPLASLKIRGDFLLAVGSPFGALSPLHFHNSMSVGFVANGWPRTSSASSLLMVDLRCLPGMEGGPVFDEYGGLVGIVTRPLRQRTGGAEVQLVTTSDALAGPLKLAGVNLGLPLVHQTNAVAEDGTSALQADACMGVLPLTNYKCLTSISISPAIEGAVSSVVLITIGDGAWASGVLLTEQGLILTNAHLLEPWRFVKTRPSQPSIVRSLGEQAEEKYGSSKMDKDEFGRMKPVSSCSATMYRGRDPASSDTGAPKVTANISSGDASGKLDTVFDDSSFRHSDIIHKSNQPIRVRIDDLKLGSCSWHGAKAVFVSQGPLDIALLQLDSVPSHVHPIIPERHCPMVGSTAVVIGHGLFGPKSELCPSVSAGVVARVVNMGATAHGSFSSQECRTRSMSNCAAMLETTAAVHPGGSGGAVVNAEGRMIGLVTSNARHSGGTVIPNLNFSVPCAALSAVFEFAAGNGKDPSLLLKLDEPNEQLSAVWALVPPPSRRPSPLIPWPPPVPDPSSMSSVEKGTRFAKFITDKVAERSMKLPQPCSAHSRM